MPRSILETAGLCLTKKSVVVESRDQFTCVVRFVGCAVLVLICVCEGCTAASAGASFLLLMLSSPHSTMQQRNTDALPPRVYRKPSPGVAGPTERVGVALVGSDSVVVCPQNSHRTLLGYT